MHDSPRLNIPPPYRGPVDRGPISPPPSGPSPWNVFTRALLEGVAIGAVVYAVICVLRAL